MARLRRWASADDSPLRWRALHAALLITDKSPSVRLATYTVPVAGLAAMPCGAVPTVVVGAAIVTEQELAACSDAG